MSMNRPRLYSARARVVVPLAAMTLALRPATNSRAQEASPVAGDARTLDRLLGLVPADVETGEEGGVIATFADLAGQLAAVGVARPESMADEAAVRAWQRAVWPLALVEPFGSTAPMLMERNLLGFDLIDVNALLGIGPQLGSDTVLVLQGRFDAARFEDVWSANGYRMRDLDGVPVASLFEEADVDFGTDLGRFAHASLNNAALLPDGTLIYTPSLEAMRQVLATVNGDAASLAQQTDIRALNDAQIDEIVSGILFPGQVLAGIDPSLLILDPDAPSTITTQAAGLGEMPPIALGLVGMTAGGPLPIWPGDDATPDPGDPAARVICTVLMAQPGTAQQAGEVASARLATMDSVIEGKSYRELFASWEVSALADGQVLRLEITLPPGAEAASWSSQFVSRDILFLAW